MENNKFRSLLQSVILHWQQSAKAYAEYMENGKKFRYAEQLKMQNTIVKNLLTDNITIIPPGFKDDVEAIIEHYTIWTEKWEEHNSKLNPGPDDEFVFENDHRFPKSAAEKLEAAFQQLRTEKAMPFFAPELFIKNGVKDISFYTRAFGAVELRRFANDDGTIHVSEMSIGGALFHFHEITNKQYFFEPGKNSGTTVCIGLFVEDVDEVMEKAISAGGIQITPATSHDYGYRQGVIQDPFGHYWQIQQKI